MKLKLISIDEKELKEYLVKVIKSKALSAGQIGQLVEKLEKTRSKTEKENLERELVEANLRIVTQLANSYRGAGVTFAGLIVSGNKALVKAVKELNKRENEDVLAFLSWRVEGAVMDAVIAARKD
jgi:DNA-directed RNA polymerase sigma subunit (sigma70/sigma32)